MFDFFSKFRRFGRSGASWAARLGLTSLVVGSGLVLGSGIALPVSAQAAKKVVKCDAVAGWTGVVGRPSTLSRLGVSGVYVWNEKGVWRLSVTHGDRRLQKFQGTITFDAPITAHPVGAEGTFGDAVQTNGSVASFTFANYGGVDGIALASLCATTVTIAVTIDGQTIAPTQIFLGSASTAASSVPVVLTKFLASSATAASTASAAAPVAAVTPVVQPAAVAVCANASWPTGLQGRPAALKNNGRGAVPGMYLWAEKATLRLAVVGEPGRPAIVDGKVSSNAEVRVAPIGLEGKRDALKADGTDVIFSFKSGTGIDGLELVSPCASQVVVEATIDDGPITLFLGPSATAVPAMPYLVTK